MQYRSFVEDLIRTRTSVRSFKEASIPHEAAGLLEQACEESREGAFGSSCRFRLLHLRHLEEFGAGRIGTYGLIKNARSFLAGAVRQGPKDLEDFGFLAERLVLLATDLNLGTCWIGGIFNRSVFARVLKLQEGETLPAVIAVGLAAEGRSAVDRLIRFSAGSSQRRSWTELFFRGRAGQALDPDEAGRLAPLLEMVRLAPSASNRQPWRVILEQTAGRPERLHFYLRRSPGYRNLAPVDLQRVDMGIALSHFLLTAGARRIPGDLKPLVPFPNPGPEARAWEYTASWTAASLGA